MLASVLAINSKPCLYALEKFHFLSDQNLKQFVAHTQFSNSKHASSSFQCHKIFDVPPQWQFGFWVGKKRGIIQSTREVRSRCCDPAIRWKLNSRPAVGYLSRCADKTGRRLNRECRHPQKRLFVAPRRRGWWVIIIYWAVRRRITKMSHAADADGKTRNCRESLKLAFSGGEKFGSTCHKPRAWVCLCGLRHFFDRNGVADLIIADQPERVGFPAFIDPIHIKLEYFLATFCIGTIIDFHALSKNTSMDRI